MTATPGGEPLPDLAFGRCVLRPAARQLLVDGQPVTVGARAFDLLLALVARRDRVVSKDELLDLVWPGLDVEENNLQVHVAALRKQLGPAAIATASGRGYRFVAEVRAAAGVPSLVGRDLDLQQIGLLMSAHRLVSLVGAGGVGKTALARALAAQQAGRFRYGACWVDLAPLSRAEEVAPCIANALLPWRVARQAAADEAGSFSLLLVLDACERLVQPVAEWAAAALAAGPGLHLLATSQEALRLPGEQVHRVAPLSADEQAVLRRLVVMDGSFSPAAAQAVAAGGGLDTWAVLDHLGALVDKSLLDLEDAHREPRLRLPESVRPFALGLLAAAGEEAACRHRHLAHMLDLAEMARSAWNGPSEGLWLSRLDLDRDNLLAALAWCDHAPDGAALGLRLVSALHGHWLHRGSLAQAGQACAVALARPGAASQGVLQGQALWVAGCISEALGQPAEALGSLQQALVVAQACNDTTLQVRALTGLGTACAQLGRLASAREHLQQALSMARAAPHAPQGLIQAVAGLGELEHLQGHLDAAQPLYEEALRRARALGDRTSTLALLAGLCRLALVREPAVHRIVAQRLMEALSIADELDSARGRAKVLEVCAGLRLGDAPDTVRQSLRALAS